MYKQSLFNKLFSKAFNRKKIFFRSCFEVLDGIIMLSCLGLVFSNLTIQYLRYSIGNKKITDLLGYIKQAGFYSSFDKHFLGNIVHNLINGILYLIGGLITICSLGNIENRFVERMAVYRVKRRIKNRLA